MRFTDTPPMKGRGRQKCLHDLRYGDRSLLSPLEERQTVPVFFPPVSMAWSRERKTVAAGGTFRLVLPVEEGRNEIELLFTDSAGNVTCETHNVVCPTNYDSIVDAAYTGEDGTEVNGIPTYRTVQAAVDAVRKQRGAAGHLY